MWASPQNIRSLHKPVYGPENDVRAATVNILGPIRTRPYFAKLIDRCVSHKLSSVRTDQTNIKASEARRSLTKDQSVLDHILFLFHELAGQFMKQKQNMAQCGLVLI